MRSTPALFLLLILPLVACTAAEDRKKIEELEERVAKLEQGGGGIQKLQPAAKAGQVEETPEDEAARTLMVESQQLFREGKQEEGLAKLKECVEKYGSSRMAARCQAQLGEASLIGSKVDSLAVGQWIQGRAELGKKDTLLVFWETWCPHCQREVPKLEAMHKDWSKKGLQVVGLTKMTRGSTEDTVKEFVSQHGITYPIGVEANGAVSTTFAVRGVPAAAFVAKDGTVKWRGHPAQIDDAKLKELMGS